jgi:spore maturation protein SpmA
MLNKIWFWLLFIGLVYGFGKGVYRAVVQGAAPSPAAATAPLAEAQPSPATSSAPAATHPMRDAGQKLTTAAADAAKDAVGVCIILIGVMTLWLGMLNIAKQAGMVDALARLLRPLTRWLFPEVPAGHPAEGGMLMNISANMLGMDNAATPFGLQAMRDLEKLNPRPGTATNAMAMLLAINTGCITLVPFSVIALRVAAGSKSAAKPLAGMILASIFTTVVAVIAARMLSRLPRYRVPEGPATPDAAAAAPTEGA